MPALNKIKDYTYLYWWQSALVWFLSRIVNQLNNTGMKRAKKLMPLLFFLAASVRVLMLS